MSDDPEADYCGCCGTLSPGRTWCSKCQTHVLSATYECEHGEMCVRSPWDRTWTAQHGTDCPNQGEN